MPGSTFQTNSYDLDDLLKDCHTGVIQLPEFQRGWVWDEDRIKSESGRIRVFDGKEHFPCPRPRCA